jgi:hypothetical protein
MHPEMSQKNRPSPEQGEPRYIAVLPPIPFEGRPPPVANHVEVAGSTDMVTLDFFFIADATWSRALRKSPSEGIERDGERAIIRAEPVARVALPITVAAEMLVSIFRRATDGVPEITSNFELLGKDIKEVLSTLSNVLPKGVLTASPKAEGSDE